MEEKKSVNDSKSEGNLHPKTVGRAAVLLGFAVLLFSALLVRIFLLQTVKYDQILRRKCLKRESANQFILITMQTVQLSAKLSQVLVRALATLLLLLSEQVLAAESS